MKEIKFTVVGVQRHHNSYNRTFLRNDVIPCAKYEIVELAIHRETEELRVANVEGNVAVLESSDCDGLVKVIVNDEARFGQYKVGDELVLAHVPR
jgi:hypothetical protein